MPSKDPIPKWGYDNSTAQKRTYHLEDHQKQKIEKMLGVKVDAETIEELNRAGGRFFLSLNLQNKPKASNIKPALKALIKKSNDLIALLNALDSETKFLINERDLNLIEKLEGALIMVKGRSKWVLEEKVKKIIDKGGHPREIAQDQYIFDLSLIYKRLMGKEPTISYNPYSENHSGLFLDFCLYCFKTPNLKGVPYSEGAVGSAIKRVLKRKR
ncbi:MAG: hypothetical protein AB1585_18335 [Thermodesulfobacteriota bacterium]